jgi:hypothetical protein
MKREFYAVDYYATETLQNGNERETTQTVYFPRREENSKFTKWGSFDTMARAEEELTKQHYYKLIYKGTRIVKLNVVIE